MPEMIEPNRPSSEAAHAFVGLKFINEADGAAGWGAVAKRFDHLTITTANRLLPRSSFWECIGMNEQSKDFAGKLFDALCRRSINITGDCINKAQLEEFWSKLSDQSFHTRLQIFFDMVDKDADGRISEEEVKEIISLSASTNKLPNIQNHADEYASLIMEELDRDKRGFVLLNNLEMLLLEEQPPTAKSAASESKKLKPKLGHNVMKMIRWYEEMTYSAVDNWKRVLFLALWIGAMAGLFAYKYVEYKHRDAYEVMGTCVCLAKGAAETLKLNMALILFPVCRNTITWLRNKTRLGVVVPFDDNIKFHQVIAVAIAFGVGIHGIAHLSCDFPRILNASPEKYKTLIPYFGKQPNSYWHFVKGVEGITGLVMVALMAIAFTLAAPWFRRDKLKLPKLIKKLTGFNAFWYSHRLFVIVYALLLVHGTELYLTHKWYKKTTWMYLAVPVILYACEILIREFRSNFKQVKIQKVVVYTEKVLTLQMSKPDGFEYRSGQYMFLNCAAVSPYEWHPFSLTSAPRDDYLSLHIQAAGDWTKRLRTVFSKVCQAPPKGETGPLRFESDGLEGGVENNHELPKLLIDGPYGAPAQDYKKYEVVLLVGLGIGATPMISIVRDILNNMKPSAEEKDVVLEIDSPVPLNKTETANGGEFMTKRAYLYWVTREQGSFEWFKETMNDIAETDKEGVIEMHNYCTSVYEEGDARSAIITMLQDLNHAKNGVDVVAGTRAKTHFARPNWRKVYKRIALNHAHETVGVFYCGAPALAKELGQLASDFSQTSSTRFQFHKENF